MPWRVAGDNPALLTLTVNVVACVGVAMPDAGVTESQLAPSVVTASVANVSAEPVRFDTATLCDPAGAPPTACVKINPVGTTTAPGLLPAGSTFRITETDSGELFAVADVTWICPLYWPGVRLAGFTDTITTGTFAELASVLPELGVTESQLPVSVTELATDQSITPVPLLKMPKLCEGTVPP